MAYKRFIDVSSFQPDTLAYFKAAKAQGISAVIVKITEGGTGTKYTNPKAKAQIANSKAAGLIVQAYHFLKATSDSDARGEAQYFAKQARAAGIGSGSIMAIDVEASGLTTNKSALTSYINSFTDELHKLGFPNEAVYSNTSWFRSRIDPSKLSARSFWVAAYGVSQPGINGASAWQYSSNLMIAGVRTDVSYDFSGFYTGEAKGASKPASPSKPATSKSWVDSLGVRWYAQNGTYTLNTPTNLRWGATVRSTIIGQLRRGSQIKYDAYGYSGGYVWIRQPRGNKQYAYIATGQEANGKRINYWGTFK
ncbi:GH25 family lysozyme [Ligilactobacillus acidipiscis]|uniref:GH25 family lysozyme n=1 Tax=Ligilactobacillus acidipiscis TaxID=89059 RepID=UPI0023F6EB0B|nr:GH25 family lysozyme [Ligilactobacillus acidipiscis]WEV56117.1 GH25 family lysozyme [Ligilactobacillus acidipiscis]